MKTTTGKTKHPARLQDDKDEGGGMSRKKFNQALGIENFNKPGEPTVTPPEEVKKKPGSR